MGDDIATADGGRKHSRKIPAWVWSAIFTELLRDVVPALFGIVTTILVLLKAGLLQLAHWPVAAFIALILIEVILIGLVFGLTILYAILTVAHVTQYIMSKISKTPTPKRPRWLMPIDSLAALIFSAIIALMNWRIGIMVNHRSAEHTRPRDAHAEGADNLSDS